MDAHHDDVQGCEVVPPEVQVKITKDIKIVQMFKIGQLNHLIVPPQPLSKIQVLSPDFGQLEMGDTEDRDHLDSIYFVLDLEAIKVKVAKHENLNDISLTTRNGLKGLKKSSQPLLQ